MKNQIILFTLRLFFISSLMTHGVFGTELKTHGYLRSGVGTNSKGGDQSCFKNSGTPGNEFRLGNECGTYGELVFDFRHLKTNPSKESPFFRTQVRLAFAQDGHTNWEGANGKNPIAIRETFVEGGGFSGAPYSFWVGKRFYRSNDVYMNDFYYIFDMSGNGGGVGDIPFFNESKLAIAWMREISSTTSDSGALGLSLFDVRAKEIKINETFKIDIWASYASSPKGLDSISSKSYAKSTGFLAGVLFKVSLQGGFNHFALLYGKGLLDDFNLYGDVALEMGSLEHEEQKRSQKVRLVEHLTLDISTHLSTHFSASFELRDNGKRMNNNESWWSLGVHPVYYFTDHYQLAGVIGTSIIKSEGSGGPRTLTRVTIAPQISLSKSIWSRPLLRAFYTHAFWSSSNRGAVGGRAYQNTTKGASYGLQAEVWF